MSGLYLADLSWDIGFWALLSTLLDRSVDCVPRRGFEPPSHRWDTLLKRARLPISPPWLEEKVRLPRIERGSGVPQTPALSD